MASISSGWDDQIKGVTSGTSSKQSAHFRKWKDYANSMGIKDPWLRSFSVHQRNLIMSGFANSIRNNEFGKKKKKKELMGDTVATTLNNVSTTFRQCSFRNPTLDEDGMKSILISRQVKGYRKVDPATKHQLALPFSCFKTIYNKQDSNLNLVLGQLIAGALFFAMRSCEYSKVPKSDDRKTKILRLYNLQFFNGPEEVTNINRIQSAQFIRITFEYTKTDRKNDQVIQHRTDSDFCPVKIWAQIKKRVLSYPKTSDQSKVNLIFTDGKLKEIASSQTRSFIRSTVLELDPLQKSFDISRIGTHSIRTSTAMILHCAKKATYIIMMLGRWASEAFMKYIRSQLSEFSSDLSSIIINSNEKFFNLPAFNSSNPTNPNNNIHQNHQFTGLQTSATQQSHSNDIHFNEWN